MLFAIPTLIMVVASFRYPGEFGGLAPLIYEDESGRHLDVTLENYTRFFSDWLYTELFVKSLAYAALTALLCLVIAYPLAMLLARSPKGRRELLVLLVILPFWSNFLIRDLRLDDHPRSQLGVRGRAQRCASGCSRSVR